MSDLISKFVSGVLGRVKGFQGNAASGPSSTRGFQVETPHHGARAFATVILAAVIALVAMLAMVPASAAQTELAGVSGRVTDSSGGVIVGAEVEIKNVETNVLSTGKTNQDGLYTIPSLHPGSYLVNVRKPGFKSVTVTQLTLNVQDNVVRNFALQIGSVSETVTINGSGLNINTTDAAVSTIVDRQFVENMPLNGRSFQDLLTLSPGVSLVGNLANGSSSVPGNAGEITVNGQRTEANYFTVDGVSANTGTNVSGGVGGAGFAGGTPGETILGTTQSLVSIDALQEFRASTSTYSAEYGRTPGGQFAFTTRSGTNDWHGSAFEYFRNEVLDANNWFNNSANPQVPRLPERQNDFGGTLGGPVTIPGLYNGHDRTFFFFSYEGLRLTIPQPFRQYSVPDATLRQQAPAPLQPFLNVFPVPNGSEVLTSCDPGTDPTCPPSGQKPSGLALYNLAYSAPSSLDNVGIRIDHNFGDKLRLFGRYANTQSSSWSYFAPAIKQSNAINVRTLTIGATSSISRTIANELRFNITQNNMKSIFASTNQGGAIPFDFSNLPGPDGKSFSPEGTEVAFFACFSGCPFWILQKSDAAQRQYNVTNTLTWSRGKHQIKLGIDWRRLTTFTRSVSNQEVGGFFSEAALLANSTDFAAATSVINRPIEPVYHNFSAFVQDDWKVTPRLSISLGLRWDVNPAPGNLSGPSPYTVDQITDLATTKLAPLNTPLWRTDWHGFAPRVGLAYQLRQEPGHETVIRTGFGLFYDMGNTQGSSGFQGAVGFSSSASYPGAPFPLTSAQVTLPPPSLAPPYDSFVWAFDPNLTLPYTMQWNLALEQGLGSQQSLTVSYVGSGGRKLLSTFTYFPGFSLGNPNFSPSGYPYLYITSNRASSGYDALQVKYQKNLSHGLQSLISYTWSHSIDNASNNFYLYSLLRASSDFDIRHNVQAAVTYTIPGNYSNGVAAAVLKHWGIDTRISARSALPVDIGGGFQIIDPLTHIQATFQPNLVSGQPVYLNGSQYPGGRIINYNAFTPAPSGTQGDVPRNFTRGFGAVEADIAMRREFPIHERLHLQFRAEAFNVFNHPNFGAIYNNLNYGLGQFGYANSTLNASLGGLNPLYQLGGPRSLQLSLKLAF